MMARNAGDAQVADLTALGQTVPFRKRQRGMKNHGE